MALRYHCATLVEGGRLELSQDVAHHLRDVLRAQPGARLELFDGHGRYADARVVSVDRRRVEVEVLGIVEPAPLDLRRVEVALSMPRGSRFDQVLEHGTELGIAALRPVVFERTPPHGHADKRERWRRTCLAAAAQCGRLDLPELAAPVAFGDLLDVARSFDGERWIARAGGGWSASGAHGSREAPALLVVGPEGGLTEAETASLDAVGFSALGIGPTVLRVETAALAGSTLLLHASPRAIGPDA